MEVKIIQGKWKAVFENDIDSYFNLSDVQRKLFGVLIACECIIEKHIIKTKENEKRNIKNRRF